MIDHVMAALRSPHDTSVIYLPPSPPPPTTFMHDTRNIQHNDGKFHYLTPVTFYAKLVALYITKGASPLPPVSSMRDTHDTYVTVIFTTNAHGFLH